MDERYEYFLIDRNGLWKEHVESVKNNGAANVSPLSRLIYACEVGDGIDQHASEDLKAVSAELAALRERAEKAEAERDALKEFVSNVRETLELHSSHWEYHLKRNLSELEAALKGDA